MIFSLKPPFIRYFPATFDDGGEESHPQFESHGFFIGNFDLPLGPWIGLRENLQQHPIFNGKNRGFL